MSMYSVTKVGEGKWRCFVNIQDGHESWYVYADPREAKDIAIQAVIQSARVLNGVHINEEMITVIDATAKLDEDEQDITDDELDLLEKIRSRHKIVLDYDDFRIKANLLRNEVETLIAIREGRKKVVDV